MKPLYFDLAPWIRLCEGSTTTLDLIISAKNLLMGNFHEVWGAGEPCWEGAENADKPEGK